MQGISYDNEVSYQLQRKKTRKSACAQHDTMPRIGIAQRGQRAC